MAELEATAPRELHEPVLLAGVARRHSPGHLPRPLILRLTPSRLVALQHHAVGADHVLDLPHAAVHTITLDGHVIVVTWRSAATTTSILRFKRWTGQARIASPLRDMPAVAQQLNQWLTHPDRGCTPPITHHK